MEREKRTERFNMKMQPSLKMAAEKKAEAQGYSLSRYIEQLIRQDVKGDKVKRYVFAEFRDSTAVGGEVLLDDAADAVKLARGEWDRLSYRDQRSYQEDAVGTFRVFEVELTSAELALYEDGELELPLTEYETRELWSGL